MEERKDEKKTNQHAVSIIFRMSGAAELVGASPNLSLQEHSAFSLSAMSNCLLKTHTVEFLTGVVPLFKRS